MTLTWVCLHKFDIIYWLGFNIVFNNFQSYNGDQFSSPTRAFPSFPTPVHNTTYFPCKSLTLIWVHLYSLLSAQFWTWLWFDGNESSDDWKWRFGEKCAVISLQGFSKIWPCMPKFGTRLWFDGNDSRDEPYDNLMKRKTSRVLMRFVSNFILYPCCLPLMTHFKMWPWKDNAKPISDNPVHFWQGKSPKHINNLTSLGTRPEPNWHSRLSELMTMNGTPSYSTGTDCLPPSSNSTRNFNKESTP